MTQRVSLIFLIVLVLALLPLLFLIAWPFSISFILASIVAIVVNPAKEWLSRKLGRPALATALITFGTVSLLTAFFTIAGITITREVRAAYNALNQRSLEEGGWPALVAVTVDRVVEALATRLPIDRDAIRSELIDRMESAGGFILDSTGAAFDGVTTAIIAVLLVTTFLYFLLRHGTEWLSQLTAVLPLDPRITGRIFVAMHDSVVANVSGVFVVAVSQGLLLILGFWFVGVRSPVLFGSIGGVASILPVLGAPLIWVPVVIAFVLQGLYGKALLLGLWGSLLVGSIDNVLRPLVVGARIKQHPVLIGLSAIGGTYAFGVLGILLGPLILSLLAVLLREIELLLAHGAHVTGPIIDSLSDRNQ